MQSRLHARSEYISFVVSVQLFRLEKNVYKRIVAARNDSAVVVMLSRSPAGLVVSQIVAQKVEDDKVNQAFQSAELRKTSVPLMSAYRKHYRLHSAATMCQCKLDCAKGKCSCRRVGAPCNRNCKCKCLAAKL